MLNNTTTYKHKTKTNKKCQIALQSNHTTPQQKHNKTGSAYRPRPTQTGITKTNNPPTQTTQNSQKQKNKNIPTQTTYKGLKQPKNKIFTYTKIKN